MKKYVIILLISFIAVLLGITLKNVMPSKTYKYNQEALEILFAERNNENVVKFVCDDFNMDGDMEAFVITGVEEYTGYFTGSLWYISASKYMVIMNTHSGNFDYFSGVDVIQNNNAKHFIVNCANSLPAFSTTYIWEISNDTPKTILSLGNCFVNIIEDELTAVKTGIGKMQDKALVMSGRIWCTYYFYWDGEKKHYQECISETLSSKDFFNYKNAMESINIVEEALNEKLKEELSDNLRGDCNVERTFIKRQNGIVNINYTIYINNAEFNVAALYYHAVLRLNSEGFLNIYEKEPDGYLQDGLIDNIGFYEMGSILP